MFLLQTVHCIKKLYPINLVDEFLHSLPVSDLSNVDPKVPGGLIEPQTTIAARLELDGADVAAEVEHDLSRSL